MKEENILSAVSAAKEAGIRVFDTSPNYKVDISLGQAFKQVGLRREEIIIVEKVDTSDQLFPIGISLENCLKRLDIDYIDLYLIHWPFPERYIDTWKQMEQFCREGIVKSIGVCNFMPHHLDPLLKKADIIPAVNQIELHPMFTQIATVEYCRRNKIAVMAYTPLGRMNKALINNPLIISLARKYGKTVPQIILRWDTQSNIIVIPKSESPLRIRENGEIFDFCLLDEEIAAINALNCDMRLRFDPDDLSRYPLSLSRKYRLKILIHAWAWKLKHFMKTSLLQKPL
ncbi:glyoxal reductase [Desulfosarcina ovata subsp. sediminis]|uniref:Glyoxal reductase n=2 Tax=Desulfosarcina ovata TaxID=83564 RepID=A0A5K7ZG14_9BACT|nr:glyoxal reductase [Desulfosarcina ovata subsp. sediminis]